MRKMFGEALLRSLLALSMAAGAANAQNTTPPAEKKTTQAKKPPPQTGPRAQGHRTTQSCKRTLGCCAYPVVHSGATL